MDDTQAKPATDDGADWVRSALEAYESPLVRYATRLGRDHDRALDIVQDTFLRLVRQDRSEVEGHLAEWLFTVCRNRCLDVLRKEQRMSTLSEARQNSLQNPMQNPVPEGDAERVENRTAMIRLLDQLPERQQEVLRLKFTAGLSYKEISRVTELTVGNVGFLIHTGLKTLRSKLDTMSAPEPNPNLGIAR